MAVILDGNVYSAPKHSMTRIGGGRAQITLGYGGYNKLLKEARDLSLGLEGRCPSRQPWIFRTENRGTILGRRFHRQGPLRRLDRFGAGLPLASGLLQTLRCRSRGHTCTPQYYHCLGRLGGTRGHPDLARDRRDRPDRGDGGGCQHHHLREDTGGHQAGQDLLQSGGGGFSQAFWTIIDANITTALAGICLLNFGTGPIRGFAVTLLIGIAPPSTRPISWADFYLNFIWTRSKDSVVSI